MVGVGEVHMKGSVEMQRNISISVPVLVVIALIALMLFLPLPGHVNTRVKATYEGQSVPITGSIK